MKVFDFNHTISKVTQIIGCDVLTLYIFSTDNTSKLNSTCLFIITSGKNVEVYLVESNWIEAKAQVEKSNGDTI